MERYAWCGKIKDGKTEEYKRRHDEIWPEMKKLLKDCGIENYSIWNVDDRLFGYYECRLGADYAARMQGGSEIVKKWDEYMDDILEIERDPVTGAQKKLVEVFRLD